MRNLAIGAALLGGLLGALFMLRTPVMEGKVLQQLRPYYELLVPPSDLYAHRVLVDLDDELGASEVEFSLSHRYVGLYSVDLNVGNGFSWDSPELTAQMTLRCRAQDRDFVVDDLGARPSPFLGARGGGYSLASYDVPEDLPREEAVTCRLNVSPSLRELVSPYGSASLSIRRASTL